MSGACLAANWMELPPTPAKASTTRPAGAARAACAAATASGVAEYQPSASMRTPRSNREKRLCRWAQYLPATATATASASAPAVAAASGVRVSFCGCSASARFGFFGVSTSWGGEEGVWGWFAYFRFLEVGRGGGEDGEEAIRLRRRAAVFGLVASRRRKRRGFLGRNGTARARRPRR